MLHRPGEQRMLPTRPTAVVLSPQRCIKRVAAHSPQVWQACGRLATNRGAVEVLHGTGELQIGTFNADITDKIVQLLRDREGLKTTVIKLFKSVSGGKQTLNLQGLVRFRAVLLQSLGLPSQVFREDVKTDYVRFDFDGNGSLEVGEVYKFVKFNLWAYMKSLGNTALHATVDVPYRSLAEAGYTTLRELGEGTQGVVKLCVDGNGTERCIKCYQKAKMSVGGIAELREEFEAMKLLGCKSIAQTFEVFQDQQFYYMVNEPYHGGDFTTFHSRAKCQGIALSSELWVDVFRQCLKALEFMHSQAMIHCDIKEPNLMLKAADLSHPEVVVVDFGLSKAMVAGESGICGGTPGYIPPETLRTRKWFPGGDVFCLGVVVFQMITDSTPDPKVRTPVHTRGLFLEGCSSFKQICEATMFRQVPFHRIPREYSKLLSLAELLLEKDLQCRPKAPQVLAHSWCDPDNPRDRTKSEPLKSAHPFATLGITTEMLNEIMPEPELDIEQVLAAEEQQAVSSASHDGAARQVKLRSVAGGGAAVTAAGRMNSAPVSATASLKPGFVSTSANPQMPLGSVARATTSSPASPPRIVDGKPCLKSRAPQQAALQHRQEVGGMAVHARPGTGHTVTAAPGTGSAAAAPAASPSMRQYRVVEVSSNGTQARSSSPKITTAITPSAPKQPSQSSSFRPGSPQRAAMQGPTWSASDQDLNVRIPMAGNSGRQALAAPPQVLPVPRLAKRTVDVNHPYDDHMSTPGPLEAAPQPVFPAPRASSVPRQATSHTTPAAGQPMPCLVLRQKSANLPLAHGQSGGPHEAPSMQTKRSAPLLYRPLEKPRVRIGQAY